jgi:drug/metabolite transporter (DMT)-like permease
VTATSETAAPAPAQAPRRWLGTLVVVFSAVCFGLGGPMARLAYDGGSNPLTMALVRVLSIAVVAGPLLPLLGRQRRPTRSDLRLSLALAGATICVSLGFLIAISFIPVSLAALVLYTYPLMVGILAALTGREAMTWSKGLILLGAFGGLALALAPGFEDLDLRGLALAFVAAFANSFIVVFGGRAMQGRDTIMINFYTNLWSTLAIGAVLLTGGGFALPGTPTGQVGAAAAGVLYVGAILSWFLAMQLTTPVRMSVLYNLDAVVNILAGVFLLGEVLTVVQVAGILVVLACLILTALGRTG